MRIGCIYSLVGSKQYPETRETAPNKVFSVCGQWSCTEWANLGYLWSVHSQGDTSRSDRKGATGRTNLVHTE